MNCRNLLAKQGEKGSPASPKISFKCDNETFIDVSNYYLLTLGEIPYFSK